MLSHLSIKNYATVESLEIEFQPGMSVVTGETGAGKSIILGALGFTLGDRADKTIVRPGASRADIAALAATEAPCRAAVLIMAGVRSEHDLLGDRNVPADAYYGIQTMRATENYQITDIPISHFPNFPRALGEILERSTVDRPSASAHLSLVDHLFQA